MYDQAHQLRNLVRQAAREAAAEAAPPVRLAAVSGAKGGVGATTLAINLAAALRQQGRRPAVVDADPGPQRRPGPLEAGDARSARVAEVIRGQRALADALRPGPSGVLVAAGAAGPPDADGPGGAWSESGLRRLIQQARSAGRLADWVLLDLGSSSGPAAQACWRAADLVVLAITPDAMAVMDGYAQIKILGAGLRQDASLWVWLNQAEQRRQAEDAFQRLERSCRRFLGLSPRMLGWAPRDAGLAGDHAAHQPVVLRRPASPVARAVLGAAVRLLAAAPGGAEQAIPAI